MAGDKAAAAGRRALWSGETVGRNGNAGTGRERNEGASRGGGRKRGQIIRFSMVVSDRRRRITRIEAGRRDTPGEGLSAVPAPRSGEKVVPGLVGVPATARVFP